MENAKMPKFKCDVWSNFQTMCKAWNVSCLFTIWIFAAIFFLFWVVYILHVSKTLQESMCNATNRIEVVFNQVSHHFLLRSSVLNLSKSFMLSLAILGSFFRCLESFVCCTLMWDSSSWGLEQLSISLKSRRIRQIFSWFVAFFCLVTSLFTTFTVKKNT